MLASKELQDTFIIGQEKLSRWRQEWLGRDSGKLVLYVTSAA